MTADNKPAQQPSKLDRVITEQRRHYAARLRERPAARRAHEIDSAATSKT